MVRGFRDVCFLLGLCVFVSVAEAGGLERAVPTTRPIFQDGNYFELSYSHVTPELGGRGGLLDPLARGTGDLLDSYELWGFALRKEINEYTALTLVLDQPWGVNTFYPSVPTSGYSGTEALLDSDTLTGILSRRIRERVTIYGGLRGQSLEARAAFPFGGAIGLGGPYRVMADRDEGIGFMAGMAFEIPDIKLRIAGTYYSEIETNHRTTETIGAIATETETIFTTPQAINLELQSGIAHNTLAFGSIRWVDWSKFAVSPPIFSSSLGLPLVDYTEDWITYTIGLGRKLDEHWSVGVKYTFEPKTDQILTTLGPVDGRQSLGIAPTLTLGDLTTTAGISYVWLGDATNFAGTRFINGRAIAAGIRSSWSF